MNAKRNRNNRPKKPVADTIVKEEDKVADPAEKDLAEASKANEDATNAAENIDNAKDANDDTASKDPVEGDAITDQPLEADAEEGTDQLSMLDRLKKQLDNSIERFTATMPGTSSSTLDEKNYAQQSFSNSLNSALSNCENDEFADIWESVVGVMEEDESGAFSPETIMSAMTNAGGTPIIEESHSYIVNVLLIHLEKGKDEVANTVDLGRMLEVIPSPIGTRINAYYNN